MDAGIERACRKARNKNIEEYKRRKGMWIEIEESELTDNLCKFLRFRCKESRETEWLKNEFGTTWGCSDVYNLPGVKYEVISFITNEDAYVLRYWKED